MSYCPDCGTRMWSSGCPNCQEEKCIFETQSDCADEGFSQDFMDTVAKQSKHLSIREVKS